MQGWSIFVAQASLRYYNNNLLLDIEGESQPVQVAPGGQATFSLQGDFVNISQADLTGEVLTNTATELVAGQLAKSIAGQIADQVLNNITEAVYEYLLGEWGSKITSVFTSPPASGSVPVELGARSVAQPPDGADASITLACGPSGAQTNTVTGIAVTFSQVVTHDLAALDTILWYDQNTQTKVAHLGVLVAPILVRLCNSGA